MSMPSLPGPELLQGKNGVNPQRCALHARLAAEGRADFHALRSREGQANAVLIADEFYRSTGRTYGASLYRTAKSDWHGFYRSQRAKQLRRSRAKWAGSIGGRWSCRRSSL